MNRHQKIAWFQLAVVGLLAIASIVLSSLFVKKYEYTILQAWWLGAGYMTPLVALTAFAPMFFRKKKGQIYFDERDLMIDRQAMLTAFGSTYAFFILVCFTTWVSAGFDKPIPAYWLVRIVLGGWITSIVAHALTTLICYSKSGKGERS